MRNPGGRGEVRVLVSVYGGVAVELALKRRVIFLGNVIVTNPSLDIHQLSRDLQFRIWAESRFLLSFSLYFEAFGMFQLLIFEFLMKSDFKI